MDETFSAMYEADMRGGRPSILPEKLMRAMLLQLLFSIRSERQLVGQINYNLLFRWFVGLSIKDASGTTRCSAGWPPPSLCFGRHRAKRASDARHRHYRPSGPRRAGTRSAGRD